MGIFKLENGRMTSFQTGVLITDSPFLWVVPVVFNTGIFMGYKLDNYNKSLGTVSHYGEKKKSDIKCKVG